LATLSTDFSTNCEPNFFQKTDIFNDLSVQSLTITSKVGFQTLFSSSTLIYNNTQKYMENTRNAQRDVYSIDVAIIAVNT